MSPPTVHIYCHYYYLRRMCSVALETNTLHFISYILCGSRCFAAAAVEFRVHSCRTTKIMSFLSRAPARSLPYLFYGCGRRTRALTTSKMLVETKKLKKITKQNVSAFQSNLIALLFSYLQMSSTSKDSVGTRLFKILPFALKWPNTVDYFFSFEKCSARCHEE